jgi:Pectate lyase superfamily protein/Chaperone of endosialidase
MKKIAWVLIPWLFLACSVHRGFADETTSRLGLTVPSLGTSGYAPKINNDLVLIDSGTAVLSKTNVFTAVNTFNGGLVLGSPLSLSYGGTGQNWSAVTVGRLPYFSATGTMSTLAAGTTGQILVSGGDAAPVWTSTSALSVGSASYSTTAGASVSAYSSTGNFTSNGSVLIKGPNPWIDIKAYGAAGDGVSDDSSFIQDAIDAAPSTGCNIFMPAGNYKFSSPVVGKSNVNFFGVPGTTITVTSTLGTYEHGAFEFGFGTETKNVRIEGIAFDINTSNHAISISGASDIEIRSCKFTGEQTTDGMIKIDDETSYDTQNISVNGCLFFDSTASVISGVYVTTSHGEKTQAISIINNTFRNIASYGVHVDDGTGMTDGVIIQNNNFINMVGGTSYGKWGVAVLAGLGQAYKVKNLLIDGNFYRNERTGNEILGFAFVYASTGVVISNNIAIGPGTNNSGQIFVAPGRMSTPIVGMSVVNNYVEWFNTFIDFDSNVQTKIQGNTVRNCYGDGGGFWITGYGTQHDIEVSGNLFENSYNTTAGFTSAYLIGNVTDARNISVHDNMVVNDSPYAVFTYGLMTTGLSTFDSSSLNFYNNRVWTTTGTISSSNVLYKENGSNIAPTIIKDFEIKDYSGRHLYNIMNEVAVVPGRPLLLNSGGKTTSSDFLSLDESNNRVGINTSAPTTPLDINCGSHVGTHSLYGFSGYNGSAGSVLYGDLQLSIVNNTASSEMGQMNFRTIDSGTIGTRLSIVGNTIDAPPVYAETTASASNVFVASDGSLQRSTSSKKYKEDIKDYSRGLDFVQKLRPVTYVGKNDPTKKRHGGLIAEEVDAAGLKEFVVYGPDGKPDALEYQNMIALLVNTIMEMDARIKKLESEK